MRAEISVGTTTPLHCTDTHALASLFVQGQFEVDVGQRQRKTTPINRALRRTPAGRSPH